MAKQKIILLYKHGRPSMKEVYKRIDDCHLYIKSSRFDGYVHRNQGIRKKLHGLNEPDCKNSIVIRWGSRAPIVTDEKSVVYNTVKAVELTNSKGKCRMFLQEKGVPVPKSYFSNDTKGIKFPCIGRPEHHGRGVHFFICNNYDDIRRAISRNCTYFSEFYNKTREFRVHVFMNKVIAITEKPRPQGNDLRWNRDVNGLPFTVLDRNQWNWDVCKVALQGIGELGLDFAGVDIMAYPEDKKLPPAVFVEANSAATLINSPYVLDKYKRGFEWLFASDKRRDKWDWKKFKDVESLSWKNFQLEPEFNVPDDKKLKN